MVPTVPSDLTCQAQASTLTVSTQDPFKGAPLRDLSIKGLPTRSLLPLDETVTESQNDHFSAAAVDLNIVASAGIVPDRTNQQLLDIHAEISELSAKNLQLQKELSELKEQTRIFVESVKANRPETVTSFVVATSL